MHSSQPRLSFPALRLKIMFFDICICYIIHSKISSMRKETGKKLCIVLRSPRRNCIEVMPFEFLKSVFVYKSKVKLTQFFVYKWIDSRLTDILWEDTLLALHFFVFQSFCSSAFWTGKFTGRSGRCAFYWRIGWFSFLATAALVHLYSFFLLIVWSN